MEVRIDGIEFVPRRDVLSDEAVKLLSEVYGALWCEACYDPINESTEKFAIPLADKMMALNKILHFKK